jgi:cytochrome P450
MERFVELPVSVFDPDFTLNPYGFLEDLYPRKDILGFQSEGKNFLFRYNDCNAVLKSHDCRREPTFENLDKDDENDDYVADISSMPLKILLETAGVPVSDGEVKKLYNASCAFLQSFDNTQDEELVARCEAAAIELLDYTNRRYPQFQPGTLMHDYVQACKKNGLSEDLIKGNIIGPLIISASNTVGISSAYLLRNLDPSHWENPLELDFTRDLSPQNHIIFGGAKHVCIGKAMGVAFLRHMARGFLRYLPDDATINDADIEMDGAWITERIIQRMPIELG